MSQASSIEDIENKLVNLRLMNVKVVKVNISNLHPSEDVCLVDILRENPHIAFVGIGVGVSDPVIENPRDDRLYNVETIKGMGIQYNAEYTPSVALPKGLEDLSLFLTLGKPTGRGVGNYLSKVITGRCSPVVTLIGVDNVESWGEFRLPERVKTLKFDKRRNLPQELTRWLQESGFERSSRGDDSVLYVRKLSR
jgi:hypothetical protein